MDRINISLVDVMDYDLTLMASEIVQLMNGKGFQAVTLGQRKKLDRITFKYAKRAAAIFQDSLPYLER